MKKIVLSFIFAIFSLIPANALDDVCPSTYELYGGFRKYISRLSGENFIYTKLLENALEQQAEKELGGKIKVKISSFSAPDLKQGKFRSINAMGENIKIQDLTVSRLELNSICSFNQIQKGVSAYHFLTDFPANVKFELSADNINKITQTTDYKKTINKINSNINGFLKITDLNFDVEGNHLIYNINYLTPFSSRVKQIKIKTNIDYKNNTTSVVNGQTDNHKSILRYLVLNNALNYINPLDFSAKILENNTIETDIKQIYVSDSKVIIDAVINIRK